MLDAQPRDAAAGECPAAGLALRDRRFVDWRFLGAGGSADVYRVRDELLGIDLAIKILKRDTARGREAMRNEVLISRALRHPVICPVHDIYEGERGFGVIMDVLEGCDLKQWIKAHGGELHATFKSRLALIEKLAGALAVAHRRIVHRDIKPANIFLMNGDIDQPLIMDFGLSLLDTTEGQEGFAGTPKYMAPEQLGGFADARSDIFALGVIAYELLTGGRHPLGALNGRPTEADWQDRQIEPPSLHCDLAPAAVDRLILQMLRAKPAQRPSSAVEVVQAFRAAKVAREAEGASGGAVGRQTARLAPGAYVIGSPPTSPYMSEKPMRRIALKGCEVSIHPVTNQDYLRYCRDTGAAPPPAIEDQVFGQAKHPVVMTDWAEAAAYCAWVGGRLPTEAEWEAAAKAGAALAEYPWGKEPVAPERCNADASVGATTAVGAYPFGANALGLFDMVGNVWEWCQDAYEEQAYRLIRDGAADPVAPEPLQPDAGRIERVLRGGAYDALPNMCRTTFRHRARADARRRNIGFRVVFDLPGGAA